MASRSRLARWTPKLTGGCLVWPGGARPVPSSYAAALPKGLLATLRTAVALAAAVFIGFLWRTAANPLIDEHAFRQTQTAISVFHMMHGGPWLAYYTPVVGAPWAIPFEAPLYHWSVAALATVFPLESSGRIASAGYLAGALVLGYRFLVHCFPLNPAIPLTFVLLALLSPLYLFWGRAFLIETTAVCFGMAYLRYGADYFKNGGWRKLALASVAAALVALAKTTTWPAFVVALMLYAALEAAHSRTIPLARTGWLAATVLVGLAAGLTWTGFADAVKSQNDFGRGLTSSAVEGFIYGEPGSALGKQLWVLTMPRRMVPEILGSSWVVAMIASIGLLIQKRTRHAVPFVLLCVGSFLVPLLLFTNGHLVHDYYQVANGLFLLMGVAVALGTYLGARQVVAGALVLALVVAGQVAHFREGYLKTALGPFPQEPIVSAARFVKERTRPGEAVLALGVGWSSIVHFYSERMGLALARWASAEAVAKAFSGSPPRWGGQPLVAIVDCRRLAARVYNQPDYAEPHLQLVEGALAELRSRPGMVEREFRDCSAIVASPPLAGQ